MGSPRQYYRFRWVLRGCGSLLLIIVAGAQLWTAYLTWATPEGMEHLLIGLLACAVLAIALRYGYLRRPAPPANLAENEGPP